MNLQTKSSSGTRKYFEDPILNDKSVDHCKIVKITYFQFLQFERDFIINPYRHVILLICISETGYINPFMPKKRLLGGFL